MTDLTITISGLGGREEVSVPVGTTIADLRATGKIPEGVGVRQAGVTLTDSAVLVAGGHYVTTPPAAKHGRFKWSYPSRAVAAETQRLAHK